MSKTKVDVGNLMELLQGQPDLNTNVAYGVRAIICNDTGFGDYASIAIVGTENISPEILMLKSELRRFAKDLLAKLGE